MAAPSSQERVLLAIEHRESDRIPLDLGATNVTGMHANTVYALRQALSLDPPGTPVKVVEPYQILGEIKPDLLDALEVDVVQLPSPRTMFGFPNENWREWQTPQGFPVLVPESFNTDTEPGGDVFMYPQGDKSAPPSGHLPADGWYFDAIIRQPPIDEDTLEPEDNLEEFPLVSQADLDFYEREAARVRSGSDRAVVGGFGGTAFGDIAYVPGIQLKHPRGIRDVEEWYVSTLSRRDYVYEVFDRQCDIALTNLARIHAVIGDRIDVLFVSGTDFGMQTGSMISPDHYRELFQPFHIRVNDWIHANTTWKSFIHSCGSVANLLEGFIESGFDIFNPVQVSATDMGAESLKARFGGRIAFWGGGVDTQHTLPFGTPDEVRAETRERLRTFGAGGGFIFNPVHNIQPNTPVENVLALYESVRDFRAYPVT